MDRVHLLTLCIAAALATACIKSSPTAPVPAHTPPAPTLRSVAVTGGGSGNPGQTTQLAARAAYSDGSERDVTAEATWSSGNPSVATVSAGLVRFAGVGEADIQAAFEGMTGSARVTVVPAPIPRRALTGTVRDSSRGGSLANARVEILDGPDAGRSANTGGDGSFSIDNVAEGTFTIRVSHPDYNPVQQSVTLNASTRVDVSLRLLLDLTPLFGTYNIALSVTRQVCSTPVTPDPTGLMSISGNADGSNLTVTITERGVARSYGGSMSGDGSFRGNGGGFIPGIAGIIDRQQHDFSGSIQGRVTGNAVSAGESMTYGAPCPGGILEIHITGSR